VTAGSAGFGTAGVLSGYVRLAGDSAIEFKSGQITSLAGSLYLNGNDAFIEDSTALGSNSALTGLASIGAGAMFDLENGASVSTTGSLVNDGHIHLDTNAGDGGSSLTLAGALTNSGSLELSGGTVTAASVTVATGATLSSAGTLTLVAGAGAIPANGVEVTDGAVNLAGGTIQGTSLAVGAGVTVLGAGTIGAPITNSGTVEAEGGRLSLTAQISGAGAVQIAQDAVLELGAETTAGVAFTGADGTLKLDLPASYTGTISGFAAGDLIDLKGAAATAASATYSAASNTSTLTVALNGGGTLDYTLAGNYAGDNFTAAQEAGGDSYIKLAAPVMHTAYSYVTNFTKTHDIQTNLIKQFPTGIFTANNSFATPFDITADASGDNFYDADRPLTLSTSLPEISDVYMLLNAYSPPPGKALATVEFIGSQGADQTFTLINGVDARDFYHGIWANTIDGAATQNAFTINNVRGAAGTGNVNTGYTGTYVVDEIDFALIPAFADQTLTAIKITPLGNGTPILLGVTAKSTLAAFSATPTINTPQSATPPAAALDASVSVAPAGLTASGAFSGLAPGATDETDIRVGLDTSSAGAKTGAVTVDSGANLRFDSSVSPGQIINETGADALTLEQAQSFAATISGFGTGDTIDATNFVETATSYNFVENSAMTGGTLTLTDTSLSLTANILMTGDYSNSSFSLAHDSGTGTLVKFA